MKQEGVQEGTQEGMQAEMQEEMKGVMQEAKQEAPFLPRLRMTFLVAQTWTCAERTQPLRPIVVSQIWFFSCLFFFLPTVPVCFQCSGLRGVATSLL